jgi:WD40 repeat protein
MKIILFSMTVILFSITSLWAQKPKLVIQTGQLGKSNFTPIGVAQAAFSQDGQIFTRAQNPFSGTDSQIKVWLAATGKEIQSFYVNASNVSALAYSPLGLILAVGSSDGQITLWDINQGKKLFSFIAHQGSVEALAFSPDGLTLASGSDVPDNENSPPPGAEIKLWNAANGALKKVLTQKSLAVNNLVFNRDGRKLISQSELPESENSLESEIKIWNLETGQIEVTQRTLEPVFSFDGSQMAFTTEADFYSENPQKPLKIHVKNLDKGTEKFILIPPLPVPVTGGIFAFTPDGKGIVSMQEVNFIKIWDIEKGTHQSTVKTNFQTPFPVPPQLGSFFRLRPNSSQVAFISGDFNTFYDLSGNNLSQGVGGHTSEVGNVVLSRDETKMAVACNGSLKLWDLSNGHAPRTLQGSSLSDDSAIDFNPDGKTLLTAPRFNLAPVPNNQVKSVFVWDSQTGKEIGYLVQNQTGNVFSVAYNSDGTRFVTGSFEGILKIWDAVKGSEVKTLSNPGPSLTLIPPIDFSKIPRAHESGIIFAGFQPNGKILVSVSLDKFVRIWDTESGNLIKTLSPKELSLKSENDIVSISTAAFSPDGKALVLGTGTNTGDFKTSKGIIELWDLSTLTRKDFMTAPGSQVKSLLYSPDGKIFYSSSFGDSAVTVWDAATLKPINTIGAETGSLINFFAPVHHKKMMVTTNSDHTAKIWDTTTKKELASLIAVDQNDWLVVTPDGWFDGTSNAWRQVNWRFSDKLLDLAPVEGFFSESFRPELLEDILLREKLKPPKFGAKDRRLPQISIELAPNQTNLKGEIENRTVKLNIQVAENPADPSNNLPAGGVRDVRLFRNGSLVKRWRGAIELNNGQKTLEAEIPVVYGPNNFSVYGFNRENIKSEDDSRTVNGAAKLEKFGTAYVICIGINNYANSQFDLKFAAPDAIEFGTELERQQKQLGKFKQVKLVRLLNEQATKSNILAIFDRLSGKRTGDLQKGEPESLAELKETEPEDAIFLFFSGHGTSLAEGKLGEVEGQFFLIPHDLGYSGERKPLRNADLKLLLKHSISDREMEMAFERIDAGLFLFVIDACNSGQALESDESRQAPLNTQSLAQLAYEKGLFVVTASQGYQAARESSKFGHGFLTQALVGLGIKQGQAFPHPTGEIEIRRWLDFAANTVPKMQAEWLDGCRDVKRDCSVREEDKKLPVQDRRLQQPRLFYRREQEAKPIIIARYNAPK